MSTKSAVITPQEAGDLVIRAIYGSEDWEGYTEDEISEYATIMSTKCRANPRASRQAILDNLTVGVTDGWLEKHESLYCFPYVKPIGQCIQNKLSGKSKNVVVSVMASYMKRGFEHGYIIKDGNSYQVHHLVQAYLKARRQNE